jgi:lipoprotein-anchoring transpeptidase ErfK/SrfK
MDPTLGANVSHGCVRLALDNAKWIYKYVPNKTTVVSYNRKF